jgi:hypothetical protein
MTEERRPAAWGRKCERRKNRDERDSDEWGRQQ